MVTSKGFTTVLHEFWMLSGWWQGIEETIILVPEGVMEGGILG